MVEVVTLGNYQVNLDEPLGAGAFGHVYKGTNQATGDVVAVKQVRASTEGMALLAEKEVRNLVSITPHENIIRFYDNHFVHKSFWIVMEFCTSGSLDSYYRHHSPVPLPQNIEFMRQITNAIDHLHTHRPQVIHRDLKPQNILLTFHNGKEMVKLGDFGLSGLAPSELASRSVVDMTTRCGTVNYMAPELFQSTKYTASVDIFSLGLVLAGMLDHVAKPSMIPGAIGIVPVPLGILIGHSLPQEIVKTEPTDSPVLKGLKALITRMTSKQPIDRPNSAVALASLNNILANIDNAEFEPSPVVVPERREPEPQPKRQAVLRNPARRRQMQGSESETAAVMQLVLRHFRGNRRQEGKFKIGDKVRIEADFERLKCLQKSHGGSNEVMRQSCGKVGTVVKKILHVYKVLIDGRRWSFNPELLTLVERQPGEADQKADHPFKKYDIVQIIDNEETCRILQKEHGGWTRKMKHAIGLKGVVQKVDSDGDVFVECINGDVWAFNHIGLSLVPPGGGLQKEDLVLISNDFDVVRQLQEARGNWSIEIAKHLGETGTISEVIDDGQVTVQLHTGRSDDPELKLDSRVVTLVAKRGEVVKALGERRPMEAREADNADEAAGECEGDGSTSNFKRTDFVKIIEDEQMAKVLQTESGLGWDKKMRHVLGSKGIILQVNSASSMEVQTIDSQCFTFCPHVLTKFEATGEADVGDLVFIPQDFQMVKEIQESLGIWKDELADTLGKAGLVKEINTGNVAKVALMKMGREMEDESVVLFHKNVLQVLATKDEMIDAALRKKIGAKIEEEEELEEAIRVSIATEERVETPDVAGKSQATSVSEHVNASTATVVIEDDDRDGDPCTADPANATDTSPIETDATVSIEGKELNKDKDGVNSVDEPCNQPSSNAGTVNDITAPMETLELSTSDNVEDGPVSEEENQTDDLQCNVRDASQWDHCPAGLLGEACKIQVRLSDGSTILSELDAGHTLKAVRKAIADSGRESKCDFKLMISFPKRVFEGEDYEKSLKELGLVPSSVVIVVSNVQ